MGTAVLLALGYLALANSTALLVDDWGTPSFFPAAGLSLAVFVVSPRRRWPELALVIAVCEFGNDLFHGLPVGVSAALAAANSVEPIVAARLLKGRIGRGGRIGAAYARRAFLAVAVACGASGLIATPALLAVGDASAASTFVSWWTGDILGQMVVGPSVALLIRRHLVPLDPRHRRMVPLVCAGFTGLVAVCLMAEHSALAFLTLPAAIAIASLFGTRGAAHANVGAAVAAMAVGRIADVPFATDASGAVPTTLSLQLYLLTIVAGSHWVAALSQSRGQIIAELNEERQAWRDVVEHLPVALIEVEADTNVVTRWNPAATRLFGFTQADVLGRELPTVPPEEAAAHREVRAATLRHGDGFRIEARRLHKDGRDVFVSAFAVGRRVADGRKLILTVLQDISEQRERHDRLVQLAHHDSLTGLPNRRLLKERLVEALGEGSAHGLATSVLVIDLNGFKAVNDEHGHPVGDQLLVVVARRMSAVLGAKDTLGRVGGDEFVVVLPETDSIGARVVMDRLSDAVAQPYVLDAVHLLVSASVGRATSVVSSGSAGDLFREADAAMYLEKRRQKGAVGVTRVADGGKTASA